MLPECWCVFFLGVGVAAFLLYVCVCVYNWKLGNRFFEPLATCGLSLSSAAAAAAVAFGLIFVDGSM